MSRQIKGFVTCDSFIDNQTNVVSPLYELSDIAMTYARNKQQYHSTEDSLYSLHVFKNSAPSLLSTAEVNSILQVVKSFVVHCSASQSLPKQQMLITFIANHNQLNPSAQVSEMEVGGYIEAVSTVGVDYMSFKVRGVECNLWLNDLSFRGFFPDYEIDIINPFVDFQAVVQNSTDMLAALALFDLVAFNTRIEQAKGFNPTTHMRIINVPYHLPNSTIVKDCYFAFNQYGNQSNYDHVLKLRLYEYLLSLGLTNTFIEMVFPSILQINEFFIVPRWERLAIPSFVGQKGVHSQVSKAYNEVFDLAKFIRVYPDLTYLRNNTYHVPCDYNNILLSVSNGFYTESEVREFMVVFDDIISVTSTHPEFSRMRQKTQRLLTLLENMLFVCDAESSSQLFSRMVGNTNYNFHLVSRQGVWYLTFLFEGHQYHMLPKYQFVELNI
jgi:hypothetical protein